jgi:serine protease
MTFEYPFSNSHQRKSNENLNDLIKNFDEIRYREISAREAAQRDPDRLEKTLLEVFAKIDAGVLFIKNMVLIPVNFVLSIIHSVQRGYLFSKNFVASKYFSFIQSLVTLRTFVQNSISSGKDFIFTQVNAVVTQINTVNNNVKASIISAKDFALTQANAVVTQINTVNNNVKASIISGKDFIFAQANALVNQINTGINNTKVSVTSSLRQITYRYSEISNNLSHALRNNLNSIVLRPALVTGLIIALILPNAGVAYAEEIAGSDSASVVEEVPVTEPTEEPATEPTTEPSVEPTTEPTVEPSPSPSEITPSEEPTIDPSPSPSVSPSLLPIVIEAPTNLSYQVLVEGIKLTWEKSVSTVDKYVVTIGPENRTIDVNADLNELLLTDLNRKAAYSFSVIAVAADLQSSVLGPLELDLATIKFPRPPMNAEVGGLIVKFNEDLTSQQVTTLADTSDLTPVSLEVSSEISTNTHLVEFNQPVNVATAQEIADSLEASNSVEFAELDFAFNTANTDDLGSVVPNDPLYATKQWSLWGNFGVGIADGPTGLAKAYQSSTGLGVTVAVIDTGFTNHPDLEGQFVSGYDFVSNNEMLSGAREENGTAVSYDGDYVDESTYGAIGWDNNPLDPGDWNSTRSSSWHGTHIAGLIAALTNNGIGIAGIAPDAKIQPIRAFSWRGGLLSDVIASITWASGGTVENVPNNQTPAKVINLSFSVEAPCTPSLQLAIDDAVARGSVVVAAAGNNNQDAANFAPGNCNNVITVGAIDADGDRANYSNFGEVIDISAPGGEIAGQAIYSTSNEGTTTSASSTYAVRQGTSVATAQVSAALAKLTQTNPTENAVQLRARVLSKESVRPFTSGACLTDENCGLGYLFFGINSIASITFESASDAEVNPGPIAIFTRGGTATYLLTKSGTGPFTYTGTNIDPRTNSIFSFTSDSNYRDGGLKEGQIKTGTRFNFTSNPNATYQSVSGVQELRVNSSSCSNDNTNGYCSIFGPDIYSDNFSGTSGQSISYEWGAQGGGDDYESYGFLIKVNKVTITNAALTSNVATLTTSVAHLLQVGDRIEVSGVSSTFNGIFTISSVPTSTTLTYAKTATNVTSFATSGELVTYGFNTNKSITNKELSSNVATLTSSNHGYSIGDKVWVFGVDNTFDGTHTITSVTTNTFSYSKTATDVSSTSVSGAYVNGSYTLMSYGRGTTKSWSVTSGNIPATGDYRFRFINGTFDASGGFVLGGLMYIKPTVTVGDSNDITFPVISDVTDGAVGGTQNVSVSATSGQEVTVVSTTTSKCTVTRSHSGTTTTVVITYVSSGTCTLTADQTAAIAGGSYGPAATVTRSFALTANKTAQAALSISTTTGSVGQNLTLSTSGGSGSGAISFTLVSSGTASCTLTGTTLTAASAGTCTVTATKASDSTYGSTTTSNTTITFSAVSSGSGSVDSAPTPTPTPIPSIPTRPNNLITNPLVPTPTPTPQATNPTLVPGIPNAPRPLVTVPIENLINALRPRVIDILTTPTPQQTTAGATPAPTFSNQRALELAPDTQDKKVVELPSLVLYNNEFQPSKLVIMDNTVAQVVSPGGGLLNVEAKDGQDSVPVDNRGRVQMVRSNNVETEGTGMQPNSEFAVYLFSDPILLGIGKTDAQGKFFASFPVTQDLPIGDHTLQVNGLLPDGRATSISLPVIVVDTIATAKNQAMPQTIFVDVNPVDNALRAVYWMLIVLAVMVFLIGASYRERFFALVRRRKDDEENVQPAL